MGGWVDPPPAPPTAPPTPKAARAEERTAARSQSNNSNNNNNNNNQPSVFQMDLENKEEQRSPASDAAKTQSSKKENVVTYANTSFTDTLKLNNNPSDL